MPNFSDLCKLFDSNINVNLTTIVIVVLGLLAAWKTISVTTRIAKAIGGSIARGVGHVASKFPVVGMTEAALLAGGLSLFGWGLGDISTGKPGAGYYTIGTERMKNAFEANPETAKAILEYANKTDERISSNGLPKDRRQAVLFMFCGAGLAVVSCASYFRRG